MRKSKFEITPQSKGDYPMVQTNKLFILLLVLFALMPFGQAAAQAFDCAGVSEIPQVECEALVALYNSTNGPGWTNNDGWLQNNQPSAWYGVTVEGGTVTKLILNLNQLSGPIPPQLGNLDNLQGLYLTNNQLSGPIPPQLGDLDNLLELFLNRNQLTSPIPPELSNLSSLNYLYLGGNKLSGHIPTELSNLSNLKNLFLGGNVLSGPIPLELQMTPLEVLVFVDNTNLCVPTNTDFQNWLAGLGVISPRPDEWVVCRDPASLTSAIYLPLVLVQ